MYKHSNPAANANLAVIPSYTPGATTMYFGSLSSSLSLAAPVMAIGVWFAIVLFAAIVMLIFFLLEVRAGICDL